MIYYETLWKYSENNPFQCHLVHHKSHTDQIPGLRSERPSTNHVTHGTVFERKKNVDQLDRTWSDQGRVTEQARKLTVQNATSKSCVCVVRFAVRICIGFLDCYVLLLKRN